MNQSMIQDNYFQFLVKHIYKKDGFTGLYRGFGCAFLSKMICWYTATKVEQVTMKPKKKNLNLINSKVQLNYIKLLEPAVSNDEMIMTWHICLKKTLRQVRCQSWGILISHPFHGKYLSSK